MTTFSGAVIPRRHVLPIAAAVLACCAPCWAATPQSPEVERALQNAKGYLEKQTVNTSRDPAVSALVALALLKTGAPKDHALVKAAVAHIREWIKSGYMGRGYNAVYNSGISTILLASFRDTAYRRDIQSLVDIILTKQRPSGGFGSVEGSADTSMSQYAVLAMWEASQVGVDAPPRAWHAVTAWLLKTQLANGAFKYSQDTATPTLSMAAAGLGSLYICRCRLTAPSRKGSNDDPDANDVPTSLQPVRDKDEVAAAKRHPGLGPIDGGALQAGLDRGDDWMDKNFQVRITEWPLYYLYAVERYQAFKELAANDFQDEPDWYNQGASHLVRSQLQNGTWSGTHDAGPVSTSFAVLFLTRSTRSGFKTQARTAEGTLIGGRGIPEDLSNVTLRGGQVVVKPLAGPADELLDIMEDPNHPKFAQAVEGFGERIVQADESMLSPHLVRLKKLAGSESPQARAAAVRALARSRNLDTVPTLIFALGDADPDVVLAARNGLRLVSRKFDGFGLSETSIRQQEQAQLAKVIEQWRGWYRSVRPNSPFDE